MRRRHPGNRRSPNGRNELKNADQLPSPPFPWFARLAEIFHSVLYGRVWRRLLFSLLASNYDDHLRNHGFLMRQPGRWALSPAYDLNPVPEIDRTQTLKTPISEEQEEPTMAAALAVAPRFGLKAAEAKTILREVLSSVCGWRKTGRRLRIKTNTLDTYATAFEHPLLEEARKLS
jgi:serine/threonine-protein kinase HipA